MSDPPEEAEQEEDCEDVGVAYLRIVDILDKQRDMKDVSLNSKCFISFISVEALSAFDLQKNVEPKILILKQDAPLSF